MDTDDPKALIRQHRDLGGIVSPLVELARVNPMLIESIIELAIAAGVHAAHRRIADDKRDAVIERFKENFGVDYGYHK